MLVSGGTLIGTGGKRLTLRRGRTNESLSVLLTACRRGTVRVAQRGGFRHHFSGGSRSLPDECLPKSTSLQSQLKLAMLVTGSECSRRMDGLDTFVHISLVRLLKAGYTA
jgi:hypothetical protein